MVEQAEKTIVNKAKKIEELEIYIEELEKKLVEDELVTPEYFA